MAKLNVVIPAVEVTVGDVTYRKVERKAQAGDIVRITGTGYYDVETNASYPIVEGSKYDSPGICSIVDDGGTFRWARLSEGKDWDVYAPISEPTTETITFEGATWSKVDRNAREGDAIKFTRFDDEEYSENAALGKIYAVDSVDSSGDPQITDDGGNEYDTCGDDFEVYEKVSEEGEVEYREVKRKANIGERIKTVEGQPGDYGIGDVFTVTKSDRWSDGTGVSVKEVSAGIYHHEYVVLEPVTKSAEPERLAVGDYARYVRDGNNAMVTGDIVEITEVDLSVVPYRVKRLTDGYVAWAPANKIVRVTDEEVAEALAVKDPRSQFAIGDYVKVAVEYCEHKVGDVLKITNTGNGHDYRVDKIGKTSGVTYGFIDADKLVKLTAAEIAEIERKQAEEAAKRAEEAKWAAIGRKVNEFKVGDIVEIVRKRDSVRGVGAVEDVGTQAVGVRMASEAHTFGTEYYGAFISNGDTITLIVPVEQRFDRAEEVDAA